MDGVKNIWRSNICYCIATLSLFHFFRNSQHPEKGSVSFKNFFRKLTVEIYNFSLRKEFLETFCKFIYLGF